MNYILYLAFNDLNVISEAIYSIHSYFYIARNNIDQNARIIVYSDKIEHFKEAFPDNEHIIFENISQEMINDWLGEKKFIYRLKIKVLIDFIKKYNSNVILVDADTFFIESVKSYFEKLEKNDVAIMYYNENKLEQKINYVKNFEFKFEENNTFYEYLEDSNILSDGNNQYQIPHSTQLWNSGVVGINPSHEPLLDKILNLSDIIYKKFEDRLSEQFAYSYILQNNLKINSCDGSIFHYWYLKDFRYILAIFFNYFNMNDKQESLLFLKRLNLEGIKNKLEYKDLPIMVPCLFQKQFGDYGIRRIRLDIPEESYYDKIFFDDNEYSRILTYLSLKYKIDLT